MTCHLDHGGLIWDDANLLLQVKQHLIDPTRTAQVDHSKNACVISEPDWSRRLRRNSPRSHLTCPKPGTYSALSRFKDPSVRVVEMQPSEIGSSLEHRPGWSGSAKIVIGPPGY